MHIIEQFNGGLYDTIIASDEKLVEANEGQNKNDENNNKKQNKSNR
jgi:hypothetical protein